MFCAPSLTNILFITTWKACSLLLGLLGVQSGKKEVQGGVPASPAWLQSTLPGASCTRIWAHGQVHPRPIQCPSFGHPLGHGLVLWKKDPRRRPAETGHRLRPLMQGISRLSESMRSALLDLRTLHLVGRAMSRAGLEQDLTRAPLVWV